MIFTSVDLPAPFSPSRAWVSVPKISRSMASFAAKLPKRLVMCIAESSGDRAPCRGGGSSMRRTGRGDREAIRRRSCRGDRVAPDQELRRNRRSDRRRRLVANFGEADRADQATDVVVAEAELTQRAHETRALGG